MKHLFFGGVHPDGHKELSSDCLPMPAPVPAQVIIPVLQHTGTPCTPTVQVGDYVKLGQKIGDGEGRCAPIHASVSGQVVAIEPRPYPDRREILSIVIENDFQDTPDETLVPHDDPSSLSDDEIIGIIGEAGIVGMGGAMFPSDIKAMSAMNKVDTVIINACECEPYITADDVLMREMPNELIAGLRILCRLLEPKRAVIAIEDNKKEAIETMKKLVADDELISVRVLPTRYPQGYEKQLIQAVAGRQVPPASLPVSVGCAVFNTATAVAVYRAVYLGLPVTERIVTVTGEGVEIPCNLIARLGTPFFILIEAAGGLKQDETKVICGGPMMGFAQEDLGVPVIKGSNAIVCLPQKKKAAKSTSCIRCGKCVAACPMHLQPLYFYRYAAAGDVATLERLNLSDCMECGCCAYSCPAKLPLVERFREAKKAMKEARK